MADSTGEIVVETPYSSGSGVRGDLNFKLIVMRQVDRIGITLSRLPHESINENYNTPMGCTYEDIQNSFHDGVRLLEQLLYPYYDREYQAQRQKLAAEVKKWKNSELSTYFFKRYGLVMSLCARLGLLLEPLGEEGI